MLEPTKLCEIFGQVETGTGVSVHELARRRIYEMGKKFGYHSIMEYDVPDLVTKGRTSHIDVVWLSGDTIVKAFEIKRKSRDLDVVTTRKDSKKLWFFTAQERFVVNVSPVTGRAYFNKLPNIGLE